jgi:glycosyltransferase involved in cell wall biosynthesis
MGKKPLRVLQIISGFAVEGPLGGIERFGIELAQALASDAAVTPIMCGMWSYQKPYEAGWLNKLQQRGVEAFMPAVWDEASPLRSFWHAWQGTRTRLRGQPFDILHSHCQFGDLLALLLWRETGARAIVRTVHNEREWGKRPLRRLLLTNGIYPLLFHRELGVSQQVVNNLDQRRVARWCNRRAMLAWNALNVDRFANVQVDRSAKRQELGIPANALLVGSIGRLTAQKGVDCFLQAAALLHRQMPNTRFILVGDGELAADLHALAAQLGIAPVVIFAGSRSDVEELLPCMDLFVNSSLWEGLPTVMLESMASRVPIVATDVSGNRELIQDGKNGRLVPAGDPAALARAAGELLTITPAERHTITRAAWQRVVDDFSIGHIAARHGSLYRTLTTSA